MANKNVVNEAVLLLTALATHSGNTLCREILEVFDGHELAGFEEFLDSPYTDSTLNLVLSDYIGYFLSENYGYDWYRTLITRGGIEFLHIAVTNDLRLDDLDTEGSPYRDCTDEHFEKFLENMRKHYHTPFYGY